MKTPDQLQDAIDALLTEGGSVPDGWLVVFLAPPRGTSPQDASLLYARLLKGLAKGRKMLVGGDQALFKPRPHILHRIAVRNALEERYDYFFFPEDEVVISGYWDLSFPVLFPRDTDIGWLIAAVDAAGMRLLAPEGEE
ncbi:MAG: hypothetical protein ACI8RZ_001115 [Myxococcota bacterium]|jgi:hypothetical protein